jgi:hypothetical protein
MDVESVQFDGVCGGTPPSERAYAPVGDLIACYNYLNSIGSHDCVVPPGVNNVEFCRSGNAHVTGQSANYDPQVAYW